MNSQFRMLSNPGRRFGSVSPKSRETRFALKNGGQVGGLSNEGNTCFMNSVLQSLASSSRLHEFIEENVSSTPVPPFTLALKALLDDINGSYGSRGREFSTKQLLTKMPNGPKQNFFTGYNQEDAQEFYQLVMRIIEKEHKHLVSSRESTPGPEVNKEAAPRFVPNQEGFVSGCQNLGYLGNVYVPAHQVDPNVPDCKNLVLPIELITPVDGISAERIGCVACGEVGGIRYSTTSGISLNLPYDKSSYSSYDLQSLLDEWIKPEIIDDVNCNRCGLQQTKEFLLQNLEQSSSEKLTADITKRVAEIDTELAKDYVTDDVFEKLTTKRMVRKMRKTKQILLSRPPPLLCIHINRSVFDPNTYMVMKNSKNVAFPAVLDLNPIVAEPSNINMDARCSFRKSDGTDSDTRNEKLLYNLKAVISHYGTHNYGHYICYRKYRGTWWRISDESVYVVTQAEVLSSQGTFMLFYEMDDGTKEVLQDVSEDETEPEAEKEAELGNELQYESESSSESEASGSEKDIKDENNKSKTVSEESSLNGQVESHASSADEESKQEYSTMVGLEERAYHV
ncbi:putative ubiquitin-specific protease [Clavispora lusitaniae]|nr:putative ubiquitin-specific protease [Clavispora lusitaniae]